MKVFITVDIEGANGMSLVSELVPGSPENAYFRQQLTKEVAGACRGALEAGATKVFVRDSTPLARILFRTGCRRTKGFSFAGVTRTTFM